MRRGNLMNNYCKLKVLALLLLIIALFFSGCISAELDYIIEISEDGQQISIIELKLPEWVGDFGVAPEIVQELRKEGYRTQELREGGNIVIRGIATGQEKDEWLFPYHENLMKDITFEPKYSDMFFIRQYGIDASFEIDETSIKEMQDEEMRLYLTYYINLPGTITESNADFHDNDALGWIINLEEEQFIEIIAESRLFYPYRIAGALLVLLIIIAAPILLKRKAKSGQVEEYIEYSCDNCGKAISAETVFCPGCGKKIEEIETGFDESNGRQNCSSCGAPVDPEDKFCVSCGTPVR